MCVLYAYSCIYVYDITLIAPWSYSISEICIPAKCFMESRSSRISDSEAETVLTLCLQQRHVKQGLLLGGNKDSSATIGFFGVSEPLLDHAGESLEWWEAGANPSEPCERGESIRSKP